MLLRGRLIELEKEFYRTCLFEFGENPYVTSCQCLSFLVVVYNFPFTTTTSFLLILSFFDF